MVAEKTDTRKIELSWDDVATGNFPETKNSTRSVWREAIAKVAEKAKQALPQSNGRIDKAVQIVLADDIIPYEDGRFAVGSQSDAAMYYVVDNECSCKDSDRAPEGACKHLIASWIWQRAYVMTKENGEQLGDHQLNGTQESLKTAVNLPEAPASANVYVEIAGRKVQVTLRDENEESLLVRMQRLLEKFPANEEKPADGWCAIHDLQMKRHTNEKGSWWSHKTDNGWCHGK